MISLTEFDKRRLEGLVNLSHEEDDTAIKWFNKALKLKEDPWTYYHLAYAYNHLKNYENARYCALTAINLGYDAYSLYSQISIGKLKDVQGIIKVLEKGIKNKSPSACLEMAKLYLENKLAPDMVNPAEASKYLDLAFEYSPIEKRGTIAYSIAKLYKCLYKRFPNYLDFKEENSELYYLKIFYSYGGLSTYQKGLNVELFDAANKNDDYSIVQTLFDRFDGDAFFIFALLLLYEEYEKTGTIVITKNLGLLTATEGAIRFRHGGCYALTVLCFWSSFEGCDFNEEAAIDSLKQSKRNKFVVPETLIDFYDNIMSKVYREVQDGTFGYVA